MKKLCLSMFFILVFMVGCSQQEKTGDFRFGNFGFDFENGKTYYLVVPIEWTGKSAVTLKSIELIKRDGEPTSIDEDGINYEFFGADSLKKSGIYEESDIGDLKSIKNFKFKGKSKIVLKLSIKDIHKDNELRVKIRYFYNGEEKENIVNWKTLELLTTNH